MLAVSPPWVSRRPALSEFRIPDTTCQSCGDDRAAIRHCDVVLHRRRGIDPTPPGARPRLRGGPCRPPPDSAQELDRHGGCEVDTQGEAFFAAFARASDAVAAAVDVQRAFGAPVPGSDRRPHRPAADRRDGLRRSRRPPRRPHLRRRPRRASASQTARSSSVRSSRSVTSACTGSRISRSRSGCTSLSSMAWRRRTRRCERWRVGRRTCPFSRR